MAKEYKVGEGYYVPVRVTKVEKASEGDRYPITASFLYTKKKTAFNTFANEPDLLLTAEEIVKASNLPAVLIEEGLTTRITELEARNATLTAELEKEKANTNVWVNTAEERGRLITGLKDALSEASDENARLDEEIGQISAKKTKLEAENGKLKQQLADANELLSDAQAQVKELTEADCMRVQEFKPIIEERDKLKSELEQEKKRTQVWKDSSEEHRQRAEELEGDVNRYGMEISDYEMKLQKLGQENDSLKADILELKAQINAFGSRPSEIDGLKTERDNAIGQAGLFKSERDEFSEKIEKYKETLRKWTKKIRSQEEAIKQKDLIISLLANRLIELEKGGESNGQY